MSLPGSETGSMISALQGTACHQQVLLNMLQVLSNCGKYAGLQAGTGKLQ